jgi:hypothetical protein
MSPVVVQLAVLGCGVDAVEKEQEEDHDLITFYFCLSVFNAKYHGLVVFSFLLMVYHVKLLQHRQYKAALGFFSDPLPVQKQVS